MKQPSARSGVPVAEARIRTEPPWYKRLLDALKAGLRPMRHQMGDYVWPTVEEATASAVRKIAEAEAIRRRLDVVERTLSDSSLPDATRLRINRHLARLQSVVDKAEPHARTLGREMKKMTTETGWDSVQKAEELLKLSDAVHSRLIRACRHRLPAMEKRLGIAP